MKRTFADVILVLAVILIFLGCWKAFGQEAPKPSMPEITKLRLLDSFKSAVIAQQAFQSAQQAAQQAQAQLTKDAAEYHAMESAEAKNLGLPEGTTFECNIQTGEVTPHPPEKKAEAKVPEPKKK